MALKVTLPLPPLQAICVAVALRTSGAGASLIVAVAIAEQLFASVTV